MAASYWRRRAPARRRRGPRGLVAESRSVDVPVLAVLVAVALSVAGRADRRQRDPTRVVGEKGLLRHAVVVGRAPRGRGVAGGRGQAAVMEGEGGPRKGQAGGKTQRDGDSSHVASPDRSSAPAPTGTSADRRAVSQRARLTAQPNTASGERVRALRVWHPPLTR